MEPNSSPERGVDNERFSCLFSVGGYSFKDISTWLDLCSVGNLDSAMANGQDRSAWLESLTAMDTKAADKLEHSHSSLRWLIERGVRSTRINIKVSATNVIKEETFHGMLMPSMISAVD